MVKYARNDTTIQVIEMANCDELLEPTKKFFFIILSFFSISNSLAGAAVLGVGIFLLVDLNPQHGGNLIMYFSYIYGTVAKPGIYKAAVLLVVSGVFLLIYGSINTVALCKKTHQQLCAYTVLLVLCIAFEASAGFCVVRFQQEVDTLLEEFLYWTLKERYETNNTTIDHYSLAWDHAQKEYMCCGVNNGSDWLLAKRWERSTLVLYSDGWYQPTNLTVPVSCCQMLSKSQMHIKWFGLLLSKQEKTEMHEPDGRVYNQPCLHEPTVYNSYISRGCQPALAKHILHYNATILSAMVVLIIIQVLGILLTLVFYRIVREPTSRNGDPCPCPPETRKRSRSVHKLSPRQLKRKYIYFDEDFDDRWEAPL